LIEVHYTHFNITSKSKETLWIHKPSIVGIDFFRVNLLSWLTTKSNYQKALITRRFSTRSSNCGGGAAARGTAGERTAAAIRRRRRRLGSPVVTTLRPVGRVRPGYSRHNMCLAATTNRKNRKKITFYGRLATNNHREWQWSGTAIAS
jgi:hypothetical protein